MDNNNYNEIDLECSVVDDDDSFGNIQIKDTSNKCSDSDEYVDISDTRAPVKTGIFIDLSDDDDDIKPQHQSKIKTITADLCDDGIKISNNFSSNNLNEFESKDFNEIDMETSISEDDDVEELPNDEVDEKFNYDDYEDTYWKKLKKKYKNQVGHSISGHYAGDPEEEMRMFNDSVRNVSSDSGASEASREASADAAGESVEKRADTKTELKEIFDIAGFEIVENSDNTLSAIDMLDTLNEEISGKNISELLEKLSPYIDDCIICPLEVATGKRFKKYADWADWYSNEENQAKYPEAKKDISYCITLSKYQDK